MTGLEFPLLSFPLTAPHTLSLLDVPTHRSKGSVIDLPNAAATDLAIGRLLRSLSAPDAALTDYLWRRNALGKPFVEWTGTLAAWARRAAMDCRNMHVSNSHDGDGHLVIAAYSVDLVGIGIDLVSLPRLRKPGKDRAYFLKLARQFMSSTELRNFESKVDEPLGPVSDDPLELLRSRIAAHFSLMEAASKACGTGLRIGIGMGRSTSLPKRDLGVLGLTPEVELEFGPEARSRLDDLGAVRYEAHLHVDVERLVSVVALYR